MQEVKAGELRKGNLVSQGEIIELKHYSARIKYTSDKERTALINYVDLIPISLTEEVLLNCDITAPIFKSNFSKDIGGYFIWVGGFKVYIKYLHQLQNLYFALTSKELTINL